MTQRHAHEGAVDQPATGRPGTAQALRLPGLQKAASATGLPVAEIEAGARLTLRALLADVAALRRTGVRVAARKAQLDAWHRQFTETQRQFAATSLGSERLAAIVREEMAGAGLRPADLAQLLRTGNRYGRRG